jgi:1-deoxy-D-xylulose-5-phosphate reductoisomerase
MKRLLILGATGSIGVQALDIVTRSPGEFELVGLSAERSWGPLVEQARTHGVRRIALSDPDSAARAAEAWTDGEVLSGAEGLVRLVAESGADLVLNAIVGSAGLGPTVVALTEGIDVALANKESLVVGGELVSRSPKPRARRSCPWTPSTPRCTICSRASRREPSTS